MVNWIQRQRYLLLATFILISFFSNSIFAIEIKLINLEGSSNYKRVSPWSGSFIDYKGNEWNVEGFYKSKQETFFIKPEFIVIYNETSFSKFSTYYDNGYRSDLFKANEKIAIDQTSYFWTSKNTLLSFSVYAEFLGGIHESPCFDSYRREYHCGTGLAWSDSHELHKTDDNDYSIGINFIKFF